MMLKNQKSEEIERKLMPLFNIQDLQRKQQIREDLILHSQCRHIHAYDYFEEPGEAQMGQALIANGIYAHSFQIIQGAIEDRKVGTAIWERNAPIFFPHSLIEGADRMHYVQALETGYYLSMPYASVLLLMERFPEVEHLLMRFMSQIYMQMEIHAQIVALPPQERVSAFLNTYPTFKHVSTQVIRAMHTQLARNTYRKYEADFYK
jgi:hypothetical protein